MSVLDKYPFPQNKPEHSSFEVLDRWRQQLENDKGERAALRRAASLTEVMLSPAFMRLLRALRKDHLINSHNVPLSKIAAIAGLTARTKNTVHEGLAVRMGAPNSGGSSPAFSELRLRRILACDDIEELHTLLRRALSQLGDQANLADLAATIWNWSPLDERRPYDPRRRLAYDYYEVAPIKA